MAKMTLDQFDPRNPKLEKTQLNGNHTIYILFPYLILIINFPEFHYLFLAFVRVRIHENATCHQLYRFQGKTQPILHKCNRPIQIELCPHLILPWKFLNFTVIFLNSNLSTNELAISLVKVKFIFDLCCKNTCDP